jgi:tetratricopeptide (TPR) repeat protein
MSLINEALKKAAREEAETDESLQNAYPQKLFFTAGHQTSRRPLMVGLAGLVVVAGLAVAASQVPSARQRVFTLIGIEWPTQPPLQAGQMNTTPAVAPESQSAVQAQPPVDRTEVDRQLRTGVAALKNDKLEEARSAFTAVLALDPAAAVAHNGLGLVEKAAGNLQEAERHYLDAIRLDPNDAEAHNNLATNQAIAKYATALTLRPDYPQARLNYAIALDRAGRRVDAKLEYQKFLTKIPPELTDLTDKVKARVTALR